MVSTVENGKIVRVDMTGRVNSHEGPVFQTTVEAVAREEGLFEEGKHAHYEPRLVIVGKQQMLDGVDEALVGMKVGEEKKVEIPAEKAFGSIDPKKRRVMAFREYKKSFKKPPRVGDAVDMPKSGEQARVLRIDQGKVIIDTNHVLAGRTVYYTIKVVEMLEGEDAKLDAMIEQRLSGIHAHDLKITKENKQLEIVLPPQVMFAQQFGFMSYMLAMDLQREFPEYEKIRFVLEIEKPKVPEGAEVPVVETSAPEEAAAGKGDEATGAAEPAATEATSTAKKPRKPAKKAAKKDAAVDAPGDEPSE